MSHPSTPLLERWWSAADRALKGADRDTLVRRTDDGIARGPLMMAENRPPSAPVLRRRINGAGVSEQRPWGWDVRAPIAASGAADDINAVILEELEGGANSLELDASAGPDRAPWTPASLAAALKGVHLDIAPVSLSAAKTAKAIAAARALMEVWDARDHAPEAVQGAFNLDPLGDGARSGAEDALEEALADAVRLASETTKTRPQITALRADGRVIHDAGGSEAQEIAWVLCASAELIPPLLAHDLSPDDACRAVALALAADADVHLTIAKFRALRRCWARLAGAFGATDAARIPTIQAFSGHRMMTKTDPWTNLIRTSCAGFAAAVGGADAIVLAAFTDALGAPDAQARRIARHQQLIAFEEAHIGMVEDPAAGSFHHEALSDELAHAAWALFQDWTRQGGAVAALKTAMIQDAVADTAAQRAAAIKTGERVMVGVTAYRDPDPRPASVVIPADPSSKASPPAMSDTFTPLAPVRLEDSAP